MRMLLILLVTFTIPENLPRVESFSIPRLHHRGRSTTAIGIPSKIRQFGPPRRGTHLDSGTPPFTDPDYETFLEQKLLRQSIRTCPIFDDLAHLERERIVQVCQVVETNGTVFEKGDIGDAMFFVKSGTVKIVDGNGDLLRSCESGDYFGELALLFDAPRAGAAKVLSGQTAQLWKLNRVDFESLILKDSQVKESALSSVESQNGYRGYLEQRRLRSFVKACPIFKGFEDEDLERIQSSMSLVEVPNNVNIIKQGDEGDAMYFVNSGKFECILQDSRGGEKVVETIQAGEYFGELALLFNKARAVSVKAVTDDCVVWRLSAEDFDTAVEDYPLGKKVLELLQEKYAEKSLLNTLRKLSASEFQDLVRAASRPKKKSVSTHSTLSTFICGMFLMA